MPKALDLTNQKFGLLTAIERVPSKKGNTYWKCKCDCGKETIVQTGHLRNGSIKSCGCQARKTNIELDSLKCPICQTEFIPNTKNRIYCYNCVPKGLNSSEIIRSKKRALKHKLIEYKGGKCEKCGYNKCEGALQFHHIDPSEKEFTISDVNLNTISIEQLYQEINKCSLLCANCHAEEHWIK